MAESFEQLRLEFLAETEDTLDALQRDLNRLGDAVGRGSPEPEIVDRVLQDVALQSDQDLETVLAADALARTSAREYCHKGNI